MMADTLSSKEMHELPTEKLGPRGAVGPEMNCKPRHQGEDEVGEEEDNWRSLMFGFPRAYILGARPINPTTKEETYTL